MNGTLLRDVEIDGHRTDVRLAGGRVAEIGPGLGRRPGEELQDGAGGALLPGLTDHHLHLHAMAAAGHSTRCGPPHVRDRAALAEALATGPADEHGWVRGIGYHESVAGDLDGDSLTALHPARPVRVQHRGGALWILNAPAAELLGLATGPHPGIERDHAGRPTGRLWRADDWLRTRLPGARPPDLAGVGGRLARLGITSVTDATPDLDDGALDAIARAVADGKLAQRVHLLGVPLYRPAPPGTTTGPYKIVIADSGLPGLEGLTGRIRAAHRAGRAVAVHCVTREALVLLLAAFEEIGSVPGDRVEHAALVPAELLVDLARHGPRIVTQPGFLTERGDDYLRDVPRTDHADLYRCRSLRDAGIPLALSSDAPYGPLDPRAVIAAAVHRRTPAGAVLGDAERLNPSAALDAYLAPPDDPGGPPRRIAAGSRADLVLFDRSRAAITADPAGAQLVTTYLAGQPIFTAA